MKNKTRLIMAALLGAGVMVLVSGCSTCRDVRVAKDVAVVETSPGAGQRGFVEFYTLASDYPVPIYLVDDRGKALLVGGVGLKQGDYYCYEVHGATVAQKLRVSLPAGNYLFMAERDGRRLQIPVQEGRVTPVELDYARLDEAVGYVVYRLGSRVFPPAESSTSAGQTK